MKVQRLSILQVFESNQPIRHFKEGDVVAIKEIGSFGRGILEGRIHFIDSDHLILDISKSYEAERVNIKLGDILTINKIEEE